MICPKCGTQVINGAFFCPKCGATMQGVSHSVPPQMPPYVNGGNNGNNRNNLPVIIALIVAAFIVFVVTGVIMYMAIAETGPFTPEPTPTPTPTPTVTATPEVVQTPQIIYVTPAPQPTVAVAPPANNPVSGAVKYPSYRTFSNSSYGFSCNYPSHFSVYDDGGTVTLYTVKSSDGSARQFIAATPVGNATVSSSKASFIASHSGSITYQTSGDDYYAVNINNGTTEYYKYCKFRNGNMYWFEFISPAAEHDIYDVYINDIYQSFNLY